MPRLNPPVWQSTFDLAAAVSFALAIVFARQKEGLGAYIAAATVAGVLTLAVAFAMRLRGEQEDPPPLPPPDELESAPTAA